MTKNLETNTFAKLTAFSAAAVALFIVGSNLAFAQTYYYVNTTDMLRSVEASNPTEAIAIAPNIKYNSGVIVADEFADLAADGSVTPGATYGTGGGEQTYAYVAMDGSVKTVRANSPSEALAVASDIAPHSGVKLVGVGPQVVEE